NTRPSAISVEDCFGNCSEAFVFDCRVECRIILLLPVRSIEGSVSLRGSTLESVGNALRGTSLHVLVLSAGAPTFPLGPKRAEACSGGGNSPTTVEKQSIRARYDLSCSFMVLFPLRFSQPRAPARTLSSQARSACPTPQLTG